jgi:hypothetical protein
MTYLVTFLDGRKKEVNAVSIDEAEILYAGYPVESIRPLYKAQATAWNPLWLLAIGLFLYTFRGKAR